jgi:hypothetical protein
MPKGSDLYFQQQTILVAARYGDGQGFSTSGPPLARFPVSANPFDIGRAVCKAIDQSSDGLDATQFSMYTAEFFRIVQATSWDEVERSWDKLHIYVDGNQAVTFIMHRCEGGGYSGDEREPSYRTSVTPEQLGPLVCEIVLRGSPAILGPIVK